MNDFCCEEQSKSSIKSQENINVSQGYLAASSRPIASLMTLSVGGGWESQHQRYDWFSMALLTTTSGGHLIHLLLHLLHFRCPEVIKSRGDAVGFFWTFIHNKHSISHINITSEILPELHFWGDVWGRSFPVADNPWANNVDGSHSAFFQRRRVNGGEKEVRQKQKEKLLYLAMLWTYYSEVIVSVWECFAFTSSCFIAFSYDILRFCDGLALAESKNGSHQFLAVSHLHVCVLLQWSCTTWS